MKYPKFILISTIFIVICVGLWAWAFGFFGGNGNRSSVSTIPISSVKTDKEELIKTTVTPKITSTENILQECIADEKKKIGDVGYEKGSVLVSFQGGVSFNDARRVIESNGLQYQTREDIESDFKTNRWLGATIPKGEEFKWICTLKEDLKVKNVILNRLFDLHE